MIYPTLLGGLGGGWKIAVPNFFISLTHKELNHGISLMFIFHYNIFRTKLFPNAIDIKSCGFFNIDHFEGKLLKSSEISFPIF